MSALAKLIIDAALEVLIESAPDGKRRVKMRLPWLLLATIACASTWFAVGDRVRRAAAFVREVDQHLHVHSPAGFARLEALERHAEQIGEKVDDIHEDVKVIRDGLIRRGLADARPRPSDPWASVGFLPRAMAAESIP